MSLFRVEVTEARSDRLHGEVLLGQPGAHHLLIWLLFGVVVVAAVWLALGSYARVEAAPGILVTDRPTAKVFAPRQGVATAVYVSEGQLVEANQPLLVIDADLRNSQGGGTAAESIASVDDQLELSREQISSTHLAYELEAERLQEAVTTSQRQAVVLEAQLTIQKEIVSSQEKLFRQIQSVVEDGYISRNEYERRRQVLLNARQSQLSIEHQILSAEATRAEASSALRGLAGSRSREVATLASGAKSLEQQRLQFSGARSFVLTAPISGRVTALLSGRGQTVQPNVPTLIIVPAGASLFAEVYAPTRAIGLVRPGQETRIQFDAFPYQRFGTAAGRVISISRVVLDPRETSAPMKLDEPVYKVTVALDAQSIAARGGPHALQPGMTLTANIVLERQTFFEWLLSPLNAVLKRA